MASSKITRYKKGRKNMKNEILTTSQYTEIQQLKKR